MKDSKTPAPPGSDKANGESANRRRLGRVVHDERGCASLEWQDAPKNYVRPVLELEDGTEASNRLKALQKSTLSIAKEEAFNPYQRSAPAPKPAARGARRDLRKLSQWIKMMRELEEKKLLDKDDAEKSRED